MKMKIKLFVSALCLSVVFVAPSVSAGGLSDTNFGPWTGCSGNKPCYDND
ncbi:hypothetical protein HMPREF1210_01159 [Paenisporosarcina sp. HGH0030]|nr:hypothetical protein [Paenisporosarcina sp. HGH0030]EPD52779.1 hypothetical protein HMPREF1210_01159 [Paenisporosarcina sp. HGH0030]